MLEQPFTGCSSIQFFNSLISVFNFFREPSLGNHSLCGTCVTHTISCHSIGHQILPTQPLPRKEEDFSRGRKYPKDVPLLTYLAYFSPKVITW